LKSLWGIKYNLGLDRFAKSGYLWGIRKFTVASSQLGQFHPRGWGINGGAAPPDIYHAQKYLIMPMTQTPVHNRSTEPQRNFSMPPRNRNKRCNPRSTPQESDSITPVSIEDIYKLYMNKTLFTG